jgi:hypothetical protein
MEKKSLDQQAHRNHEASSKASKGLHAEFARLDFLALNENLDKCAYYAAF